MQTPEQFKASLRAATFRKGVLWPSEEDLPVRVVNRTKSKLVYYERDTDAQTEAMLRAIMETAEDENLRRLVALFQTEPVVSMRRKMPAGVILYLFKRFGDLYVGFRTRLIQT